MGSKTLGIASFYLRAVCQNRNLWGVEDFEEITIRHSKYAASRFAHQAAPALERFANSSPMPFVNGIRAARERIMARSDEEASCRIAIKRMERPADVVGDPPRGGLGETLVLREGRQVSSRAFASGVETAALEDRGGIGGQESDGV